MGQPLGGDVLVSYLTEQELRSLDARYDQALTDQSVDFLESFLHNDFVWVHDHAGVVQESRAALLDPIREGRPSSNLERSQEDVSVVIFENTAIVYGYTNVERTKDYVERTGNPRLVKYHFMRTYVGSGDQGIRLLGNHTMEVWREGQDS